MKYQLNLNIAPYSNLLIDLDEINFEEVSRKIDDALRVVEERDRVSLCHEVLNLIGERDVDLAKFKAFYMIDELEDLEKEPFYKLKEMHGLLNAKPLKGGE